MGQWFRLGRVGHRALFEKNADLRLQQDNRCDGGTVGWEPLPIGYGTDRNRLFCSLMAAFVAVFCIWFKGQQRYWILPKGASV